jgi:hypothetical protein
MNLFYNNKLERFTKCSNTLTLFIYFRRRELLISTSKTDFERNDDGFVTDLSAAYETGIAFGSYATSSTNLLSQIFVVHNIDI